MMKDTKQNKLKNISKKRSYFDVLNENTNIVRDIKAIVLALLILGTFCYAPILTRKIILFFDPSVFSDMSKDTSYLLCMFGNALISVIAVICIAIIEFAVEKLSYVINVLRCLKNFQYLPTTVDDIEKLNLTLPELFVELSKAEMVRYCEMPKEKWLGFDKHIKFITDAVTTHGIAQFNKETADAIRRYYKKELSKKNFAEMRIILQKAFMESLRTDCYTVYDEVFEKCLKAFVPDVYYEPNNN